MPKSDLVQRPAFVIHARNSSIPLGRQTKIMGIMNLTPDSFSGDGRSSKNPSDTGRNLSFARRLLRQGADMLDVGGESTRPGAGSVSVREEVRRVIPTIQKLTEKTGAPISVDTYKATVARHALDAGASIVNNIMGTPSDKNLLKMVRNYGAAVVLMHIRGRPRTMQKNIRYQNLMAEILSDLKKSIENCLEIGIKSDKIIIDPGIGFGKTAVHNLKIINRLAEFQVLKQPLLIGPSRKSFIGHVLNQDVKHRLTGTLAAVCAGILRGAHVVRVHDVKEVKEAALMIDAILNQQP
jgi:dihydropteroate synthase